MSRLTAGQRAAMHAQREQSWTLPFTIELALEDDAGISGAYDYPFSGENSIPCSGDYAPRLRGQPSIGGAFDTADVLVATDIAHSGDLDTPGARLNIDGVLYAITGLVTSEDFGEILIAGKRAV